MASAPQRPSPFLLPFAAMSTQGIDSSVHSLIAKSHRAGVSHHGRGCSAASGHHHESQNGHDSQGSRHVSKRSSAAGNSDSITRPEGSFSALA